MKVQDPFNLQSQNATENEQTLAFKEAVRKASECRVMRVTHIAKYKDLFTYLYEYMSHLDI